MAAYRILRREGAKLYTEANRKSRETLLLLSTKAVEMLCVIQNNSAGMGEESSASASTKGWLVQALSRGWLVGEDAKVRGPSVVG